MTSLIARRRGASGDPEGRNSQNQVLRSAPGHDERALGGCLVIIATDAENLSRGASPQPNIGLLTDNLAVAGALANTYFNVDPARFATQNRHDID